TIALMPCVKHLGFEEGEVHVRWALGRATFAGETVAQRGVEFRRAQRIFGVRGHVRAFESGNMLPHSKPHFERGTNDIGASARGHNFFARRDERRAHDRRVFAATAAAVALLEIADERAVFERKCKSWRKRKTERPLEILAQ